MTTDPKWRISLCTVVAALVTAIPMEAQKIITYDVPGAVNGVYPNMIVPSGAITGGYLDANNFAHGFLRNSDGTITTFDVPGVGGSFGSTGQSMNEQGTIVGSYTDPNDRVHGFLRDPKGRFTTFDVPGSIRTVIRDINPAGTTPSASSTASCVTTMATSQPSMCRGLRVPNRELSIRAERFRETTSILLACITDSCARLVAPSLHSISQAPASTRAKVPFQ